MTNTKENASNLIAYCYRSGQIGFAASNPRGAIPLGGGPEAVLREKVRVLARLAYDNTTLLVPGVPEARDELAAQEAVWDFCDRLAAALPEKEEA